jgi:hypothetical protein
VLRFAARCPLLPPVVADGDAPFSLEAAMVNKKISVVLCRALALVPGSPRLDSVVRSLALSFARDLEQPTAFLPHLRRFSEWLDALPLPLRQRHLLSLVACVRVALLRSRDVVDTLCGPNYPLQLQMCIALLSAVEPLAAKVLRERARLPAGARTACSRCQCDLCLLSEVHDSGERPCSASLNALPPHLSLLLGTKAGCEELSQKMQERRFFAGQHAHNEHMRVHTDEVCAVLRSSELPVLNFASTHWELTAERASAQLVPLTSLALRLLNNVLEQKRLASEYSGDALSFQQMCLSVFRLLDLVSCAMELGNRMPHCLRVQLRTSATLCKSLFSSRVCVASISGLSSVELSHRVLRLCLCFSVLLMCVCGVWCVVCGVCWCV